METHTEKHILTYAQIALNRARREGAFRSLLELLTEGTIDQKYIAKRLPELIAEYPIK
jgi:hypothetical protein